MREILKIEGEKFSRIISLKAREEKFFVWLLCGQKSCEAELFFDLPKEAKLTNIFLFAADGLSNYNLNLSVNHLGERSFSETFIRGIARGAAASSVLGKVTVSKSAKNSGAWLEGRALLFNEAICRMDPRLEILTSEVERAGHAATVSRVSDDELFYMTTRGIARKEAEKIKSEGFLAAPLLRSGLNNEDAKKIISPFFS